MEDDSLNAGLARPICNAMQCNGYTFLSLMLTIRYINQIMIVSGCCVVLYGMVGWWCWW